MPVPSSHELLATDLAVGVLLVALGILAARWSRRGLMPWLVAGAGVSWLLADVMPGVTFVHRAVLVHLVLSYPTGRLRGASARVVTVAAYGLTLGDLPTRSNLVTVLLAVTVAAVAADTYRRADAAERQASLLAVAAAVLLGSAFVGTVILRSSSHAARAPTLVAYDVILAAVGLLLVAGVGWQRLAAPEVTDLVLDLGATEGTDALQTRLARGLGDPGLIVGYWLPARGSYVDGEGRNLGVPEPTPDRCVTPITTMDGQSLAVLLHHPQVAADPRLLAAVAAAARWAIGNVRLRAEVAEQVDSVAASRHRLVSAAAVERGRLEEALRCGAQRRLADVAALVAAESSALHHLVLPMERAAEDLRALARGLHPRTLVKSGLAAALADLVAGSALPVGLDVPDDRFPAEVESAAYFICAEALANVAKHAHAERAAVRVSSGDGLVVLTVTDDGIGAADVTTGTGLVGLADRAEAAGGRLAVTSRPGEGTTVTAALPLRRRARTPEQVRV